jgi:hypothetical protein
MADPVVSAKAKAAKVALFIIPSPKVKYALG